MPDFGHSPEFYLRASSPQLVKERKKFEERATAKKVDEEDNATSEEETNAFVSNELLLRPKVR